MKQATTLDGDVLSAGMVEHLAAACRDRYHSALSEGKEEHDAFVEIVTILLETYREALAS